MTMPLETLSHFVLFRELDLEKIVSFESWALYFCKKNTPFEVCPRCATKATAVYDHREVTIKDAPVRGKLVVMKIRKRRFFCKPCKKPFTEPVAGISKGHRTTARWRRHLLWACEVFTDLKQARRHLRCSYSTLYRIYYEQLELKQRQRRYPWPSVVGIDEHKFKRHPEGGWPIFATSIVDHNNRRVYELVEGREVTKLKQDLLHIPGRERVRVVTMDLSSTYRSFTKEYFPNARIVADKFHVLRLLNPAINRYRKEVTGDKRALPIRKLLLRNGKDIDFFTRSTLHKWLNNHPKLRDVYFAKEALHRLYRIKGYEKARTAYIRLCDTLAKSKIRELRTLRKTLLNWQEEILCYFKIRRTNGRVEGFNGKAKLIKRRAYGYRSFKNYRLRVLNACC